MLRPARLALALALALAGSPAVPAFAAERPRFVPDKEEQINEGLDAPPPSLDRSTPARAWASFAKACQETRPEVAVHLLNLGDVPAADRKALGPVLGQQLCEVLKRAHRLEPMAALDDTPLGPLTDGQPANYVVPTTVTLPSGEEDVWLRRLRDALTNQHLWLVTKQTVSSIPGWYRALVTRDLAARPTLETLDPGLGARPASLAPANPREAMMRFASLCHEGHYEQAAFLLDLTGLDKDKQAAEGARLARRLGLVLKRLKPAGFGALSNDPAGAPEREVAVDEEVVARATLQDREVPLKLARYPRTGGPGAWLVSAETVGAIDEVYGALGYGFAGDRLPTPFFSWEALGVQLWQWLGLLAALALALVLGSLAAVLGQGALARLARRTSWAWDDELVAALRGPLAAGFSVVAFLALAEYLALGDGPQGVVGTLAKLVSIFAGGWMLLRLIDVAGVALTSAYKGKNDDLATAMVPVFRRVLKPIAGAMVLVVALQNVGMNVAGLLAGLGIGGLAIALAGKTALENLIGSIAIAFDRPFKIGDFIKVGDFLGTIEDVGLRSTRIRTLDRTLVSIPNGQMADAKVENFARRDRYKVVVTLGLEYGARIEQVKLVVDDLKKHLLANANVWQESFSVRFVGYGASSLNVEVFCYVVAASFDLFTGMREELLFEMGRIVERSGARFAFPSQTLYQAQAEPADSKLAEAAKAEVARRQQAGELFLPEIPERAKQPRPAGERKG